VIFGQPLFRYNAVTSTQDIARDLLRAGEPPGTVVAAQAQTQGRGRRGRDWHASPGANVCVTALCPAIPLGTAWQIALLAGVTVAEAVRSVAPEVSARVRFPNDVLVDGRKLAGILVETAFSSGDAERVIPLLGIGINVKEGPLPPEIAQRAIALETAAGRAIEVVTVESALLEGLSRHWEMWDGQGFGATLTAWRALADPEARRTFLLGGEPTLCRVVDITGDGDTILETEGGHTLHVPAAQIILGEDA